MIRSSGFGAPGSQPSSDGQTNRPGSLPLRPHLVGKTPYGAPQDAVPVRLNVNENTHPLPANVRDALAHALADTAHTLNRYPDREFLDLRAALANYLGHGLDAGQIWAANGSNEVLQQLLQAFGGPDRTLLSFTPSYSMYPLLADSTDTTWLAVPRPDDYVLTAAFVTTALRAHRPDVTILCAPNNPTGTSIDLEVIAAAYDACDGVLIIDEAYHEFELSRPSALALLPGRPRLVISRTMSKAFAFAGVRLGYLAADPTVIDALRIVRLPYHLSTLTQTAARVALQHAPALLASVADICVQRDRLARALTELGYRVHPSGANFLLVGGFTDPDASFEALRAQGILVRKPNIAGHLRLTIGTEPETTALLDAIRAQHPQPSRVTERTDRL